MNILITGGAGFIGSNLAFFLVKNKHHVWVVDNFITGSKHNLQPLLNNPLFSFINADVSKNKYLQKLKSINFDIIYHLASPASPVQYEKYPLETLLVNSLGSKILLDFIREARQTKFVFASTSEVYGDPLEHPQKESYWGNVNSYGPRSCYDEAKRFGESLCYTYLHKYGVDVRIVRIFNTYGPNMERHDGRVISNFIVQALTGQPITVYGDGKQTRSFCYIADMIEGLWLIGNKKISGEVINLGQNQENSILDIANLIKSLTYSNSSIVFKPLPQDDPKRRQPDISKAKKLLGWKPKTNLKQGLKTTINYFKNRFSL